MAIAQEGVARNTTYLTVALVVQKVLSFLFFLIVARTLGDDGTGEYVAAFSLSSIFAVFVDVGFAPVLTRELARARERSAAYFSAAVAVKVLLAGVTFVALLVTGAALRAFGVLHLSPSLVAVAGLVMVLDSLTLTVASVFRGWQNLWYEAAVVALNKVVVLGAGYVALQVAPSPLAVAVTILAGSLSSLGLLTRYLYRDLGLAWRLGCRWDDVVVISRQAWPFALAGLFAAAYSYSDAVLLAAFRGSADVGQYSVASKTMNAFQFIPAAFMAAVFPAMSSLYSSSLDELRRVLADSLRYLLLISAPLAVGLFVLAEQFVTLLGQDFSAAAAAVRVLMPSMVCVFLSFPLGALLNATQRQHWQTAVIGGGMACNVGLNLWLIPRFGFIGASWSWFVTNVLTLVVAWGLARRVVPLSLAPLLRSTARTALAVAAMAVAIVALATTVPLAVVVLVSGVVYGGALFVTAELTPGDVRYLWGTLTRRGLASVTAPPSVGTL